MRALFLEYARSLDFYLCFEDFDAALAPLPGCYALPSGRLLGALVEGVSAGCVGVCELDGNACEMARLYVPAQFRGLGRRLAEAATRSTNGSDSPAPAARSRAKTRSARSS